MHHTTLAQMAVTGLLVALLPLSMVWVSSDENKYRKLVWISVFLTFDLIVFGAFTRLTDSGLGCPDWPGCYGLANPFLAHADIAAAEALQPSGPVTLFKAWVEMIHRYLAMGIGVLIVAMMAVALIQSRKAGKLAAQAGADIAAAVAAAGMRRAYAPALPVVLFFFVCLQGAFGAWTVTLKLQPVIVTIHLLLGMGLLSMLVWFGCRQDTVHQSLLPAAEQQQRRQRRYLASAPLPVLRTIRWLALASGLALLIQLALGGWVSTNYATLACTEFPLCAGKVVPEMDFEHGFHLWRELGKTAAGHYLPFSALTAIHWVHRNFAFVVVLLAGYTAWRAWNMAGMARLARGIAAVLALQTASGLATIYFSFPLAIAVLHNAGAALLVLLLTMLNYRAKHQHDTAQQGAAPARHHQ
ncbi:COX15/CtaA family protein [Pseudoduganella aquatica]|uniref:COX15/CtaA family protein n=1 Tax=Pseudoduganella aquatica TaxID=2660641 RepID=UPI001E616285|nr:COX15/CtaA family protein [Pseudoduganella aquatica]